MSTHTDAIFFFSIVAGFALLAIGGDTYRRWERPGTDTLSASIVLLGAIPILSVVTSVPGFSAVGSAILLVLWCLATVAWFLFTLKYTGTYTRQSVFLVGALVVPIFPLVPWILGLPTGGNESPIQALSALILSMYSALALIGSLLVGRSTVRYGHLSVPQGSALIVLGLVPSFTVTLFGQSTSGEVTLVPALIYTGGFSITAVATGLAVYRYGLFSPVPAAGAVGERALLRETDDIVAIVDMDDRLLSLNERGRRSVTGGTRPSLGAALDSVLGYSTAEFTGRDTVELDTHEGTGQFDSQVSRLTDYHGDELGAIISLRDVTDRELRKQRLEVLNRVLGHNIRNEVSVITANAEFVADQLEGDLQSRLDSTIDSAHSLEQLGTKARRVEALLGRERHDDTAFDLDSVVEETASQWPNARITHSESVETRLECDRDSLRFALDNLLENAVEHADSDTPQVDITVTTDSGGRYPVVIEIRDDGPGIPETEIEVIEKGTETDLEHGSGVGLWVTNWAVTNLGGELSLERREEGGTVARVRLPSSVVAPGT